MLIFKEHMVICTYFSPALRGGPILSFFHCCFGGFFHCCFGYEKIGKNTIPPLTGWKITLKGALLSIIKGALIFVCI